MSIGRRRGRILAFQALCAWDIGKNVDLDKLLTFSWQQDEYNDDSANKNELSKTDFLFSKMIVLGTIENITEIDECISANLKSWTIERINSVDKAILRLSVYSLIYQKDIPQAVVIDEAINLAKEFGTDDSFKFVNAILDNIKKTA